MKKMIAIMTLCLMMVGVMVSCCGDSNTPTAVAIKSMKCIQEKDYEGLVNLVNASEQEKQGLLALFQEKLSKQDEKNGGIKSFEAINEEIDEEKGTAVVTMKVLYNDGSEKEQKTKLEKDEKGDWKLSLKK